MYEMSGKSLDSQSTILAFKYVFGQVERICRLCLCLTEKNLINVNNTVDIQKTYCNDTISYRTMLDLLDVPNESEMPQFLCKNCARLTMNSYLFQKIRQYSIEKWMKVIKYLTNSIPKLDSIKLENKSLYLSFDSDENCILGSDMKFKIKQDKPVDLKKFQNIPGCPSTWNKSQIKYLTVQHKKIFTKKPSKIANVKKNTLKTFNCTFCKRKFLTHKRLLKHMNKHMLKTCSVCNKNYKNMQIYQNHIKNCFNKEKKFICDYCNKCYQHKKSLQSHLKIDHGFGNVLACNWCYKKFDAVSKLRSHNLRHTKEKNFECNECNRQFVSNSALVYHTRLHTGERPFPCDLCDMAFLSASRRLEHVKRRHIGPTKECSLCDMKFITTHQLRSHFPRHFKPSSKLFITKDDLIELKRRGKVK